MSESQVKRDQIQEKLISDNGFGISREDLMELFVTENMHKKDIETNQTKSLQLLQQHGFADNLVRKLKTNDQRGLDDDDNDLKLRRRIYGSNKRHQRKIRTVCDMICEVFEDFILKVLIGAAIISTTLGIIKDGVAHGFQEGAGILFAIVIIVLVTVGNDYSKEKKFQELMQTADAATVQCRRGDAYVTIDTQDLVVGDIVYIPTGDAIPADCLVIHSDDCNASEAALTGEPDDIPKEPVNEANISGAPDPFLLQASEVKKGTCTALVLAVGDNTNQGRAGLSMNITNDETPLQKKLNRIAEGIGKLGLTVAIMTFIAIVISTLIKTFKDDTREFDMAFVTDIANGLVIAITVIVVAVPEGLPLAVTISLAFSVAKMQEENNLVRKLQSSETMGNANEICTDKTGTLTQNKMTVQSIFMEDATFDGESYSGFESHASKDDLVDAVIMNSTAFIELKKDKDGHPEVDANGHPTGVEVTTGNVTECGLINYLVGCGVDAKDKIKQRDAKENEPLFKIPFNSDRKRATIAFWKDSSKQAVRIYCKGAPDYVISKCTKQVGANGQVAGLTQQGRDRAINEIVPSYAKRCLRTLLICYREVDVDTWHSIIGDTPGRRLGKDEENALYDALESDLTMVAIFGLKDPLRLGVRDAVEKCHKAGINVRMVTGDNLVTAKAISVEAGILTQEEADSNIEYQCMTGEDFRNAIGGSVQMKKVPKEKKEGESDAEDDDHNKEPKFEIKVEAVIENMNKFREIAKVLKVMARSQPDDKFMLVDGLIRGGKTVAVTGDGTNDAPALNRADVGFAMGITGTDVAKSACDIQLLDDNFCSILIAVKYGRNIYDNVRKFLQFQLTVNVVAMFIVFSGACIFSEPPLTSTQMLWVNLIMDTFAALALATEPPHDSVLDRKPSSKSDIIVNSVMWRNIALQSIYQIIILLVLMFKGGQIFGISYLQSDPFYPTEEDIEKNADRALLMGWQVQEPTSKVLMYTLIFQTFVFLQLFNQINSRKLGEREFNIFANFCNNWMFIAITLLTFGIQVVIVQFAGRYMRAVPLNAEQNLICAAIGVSCIPFGLLVKLVPARWFAWIRLEETEMEPAEEQQSINALLRRSTTIGKSSLRGSKRKDSSRRKRVADDNGYQAIN